MNKAYIIAPLIMTLIFSGFYLNFSRGYDAQQAAIKQKAADDLKEKNRRDVAAREQAIKDAVESAKKREAERKERDRLEELKKTARQEAEDHRIKVYDDRNRLRDQVNRLKKDLDDAKGTLGKVEDEKKQHLEELGFLKDYVKKAEANVAYYYDLLNKIDEAEKARAKAAADAAAAAAGKKA